MTVQFIGVVPKAGGGAAYKHTFGGTTASKNTVVITNAAVFEQMKGYVEANLSKDDKHFSILVSNGIVTTINATPTSLSNAVTAAHSTSLPARVSWGA